MSGTVTAAFVHGKTILRSIIHNHALTWRVTAPGTLAPRTVPDMARLLTLVLSCLLLIVQARSQGTLRGKVTDAVTGEGLMASLAIKGAEPPISTAADLDGNYSLPVKQSGAVTIVVSFFGYAPLERTLTPEPGTVTILNFELREEGTELKEFEIVQKANKRTDTYLDRMKINSAVNFDHISRDAIQRTGDGDASQAVRRVSGVSTVSSANLTLHRVNIVTDTANVGSITLDGTPVAASLFIPFSTCSERAWATLPLTDGIHTLSSTGGFSAIVYGTGINYETYAFSLGSGSEPTADSVICASPGPLVLTAPPGMQLPIWSFADTPNDTLALGPVYTYVAGPSTTILVRDTTASSTCSPRLRYIIDVNGGGALNVQVYQTSLCPPVTATLVAEVQPALPGMSFQWFPPAVLPLSPTADSVQVLVPSSTSFQVLVTSANGCPLGASSAVVLTYPPPAQPTITQQGDTLFASAGSAYTWYLNGSVIPGATNAWFVPSSTGVYGVAVTDQNGCIAVSPPYLYLYTGVEPDEGPSMQAWSGGAGEVHVVCSEAIDRVQVWEATGRLVAQAEPLALRAQLTLHATGLYVVRVEAGGRQLVRRVLVEP